MILVYILRNKHILCEYAICNYSDLYPENGCRNLKLLLQKRIHRPVDGNELCFSAKRECIYKSLNE